MDNEMDWIGSQWLAREYGVEPVQPLPIRTVVGGSRNVVVTDGFALATVRATHRPTANLRGHLGYALRREGVHLEFLARLFRAVPRREIEDWIHDEPSGRYARRAGFLFEWLTGQTLDVPDAEVGPYVDILPEPDTVVASRPVSVPRWRVRNNLPGSPNFCPTIRRSPGVAIAEATRVDKQIATLNAEFGDDILLRSAVWLTIKESRASFQIERETDQADRIQRFAAAMERRLGTGDDSLAEDFLTALQREILGERALRTGLRRSPVFIGETRQTGEVVHYVAPDWEAIPTMLDGLRGFERLTRGISPLIRAAVLSFGFVFIHPMADGNGRISRFLVNDTLRRDGAVPSPLILPISSTITRSIADRVAYDRALEQFSRPFMRRYTTACKFGKTVVCADGIQTNFHFNASDDARLVWSFPDLTAQCEYLHAVVRETIDQEMRREADWLQDWRQTRARLKEIVEAPDVELDRLIRSVRENQGRISGKLQQQFPMLADSALAASVLTAVLGEEDALSSPDNP